MTILQAILENEYENIIFVRCGNCGRLLCKVIKPGQTELEIKCSKCKTLNRAKI